MEMTKPISSMNYSITIFYFVVCAENT